MSKIEKPVKVYDSGYLPKNYEEEMFHLGRHRGHNKAIEQSDKYWEQEIVNKDEEIKRLADRDCNATIRLSYEKGGYPWHTEDLKVVDVGVSDNVYIVESKVLEDTQNELKALKQKLSIENIEKVLDIAYLKYHDCRSKFFTLEEKMLIKDLAEAIRKLTKE